MFFTIHSDQVLKVLFDAYATQVFNSYMYFRERAHAQMAHKR